MKITSLGHSCLLLDLEDPKTKESTRILIDPWLSDHATGDAMGRFPRLRFKMADLGPIHAVYLSHAHCDHFDPYTLVRLWKELDVPPVLLLPISLSFLVPVFQKHLGALEFHLLEPHQVTRFRGIELLGFFDVGDEATNEDDVMILVVTNGKERALIEADARLSLELPHFREYVNRLMCGPHLESAVYLSTENELTGTIESRNCASTEERASLAAYAMEEMYAAVEHLYAPTQAPGDLWKSDRLVRLIHGQGLTAPHELDPRWKHILFPVQIPDRVQAERRVAMEQGYTHTIEGLTVGSVHTLTAGRLQSVQPMPGLELLDQEEDRVFDATLPFFPELPTAPLRADKRNHQQQQLRIIELLNQRFLPYLHGLRQPPVLHLLSALGGSYRVRVHYGTTVDAPSFDYLLGFGARNFIQVDPTEEDPQEAYWANDLEDFVDGRCDEYTPFCRMQFPTEAMRLWASLATPLLNTDLVLKRAELHFERAKQGLTPGSYVMDFYPPPRPHPGASR